MPRLSRLASSALALALLIVPLVAYLMVDDGRLARMGFSLHAPRWSLLLASPTMIQIHVAAAVMALAIGVVLLIGVKGNQLHRTLGWAWVLAMGTTAISSFFIHQLNPKGPGGLSLIHLRRRHPFAVALLASGLGFASGSLAIIGVWAMISNASPRWESVAKRSRRSRRYRASR